MIALQALLLAASLGWSSPVAAVGVAFSVPPKYPHSNFNYTLSHHSVSTFILSTTWPHQAGSGAPNVAHQESTEASLDLPTLPTLNSPGIKESQLTESVSIPPIAFSPGTKDSQTDLGVGMPSVPLESYTVPQTITAESTFVPTSSLPAAPVKDSGSSTGPQITSPPTTQTTVEVDGVAITAGSPGVDVSGTTYSLAPSGTVIYVNGASVDLPQDAWDIDGVTVAAGSSAVQIHGATYSLAPSGDAIYVDGASFSIPATALTSDDIGAAVMNAINGEREPETIEITIPASGTASASTVDLVAVEATTTSSISSSSSTPTDTSGSSGEPYRSSSSSVLVPGLGLCVALGFLASL